MPELTVGNRKELCEEQCKYVSDFITNDFLFNDLFTLILLLHNQKIPIRLLF